MFRPSTKYPEYLYDDFSTEENYVYEGIRESFILLGLDKNHYGSENWNPLGEYISPGMNILIKPNLVMHYNKNVDGGIECLYTQPSLVAAVIDYIIIALKGYGKIVVGDAPMQECDFNFLMVESGYRDLIKYYKDKGIDIDLVDFRELTSKVIGGVLHSTINASDRGRIINLGNESEFSACSEEELGKIRITDYDPRELVKHHNSQKHEYYISQYILDANVIINMPKPKTHRKAGMTGALKNFVGANVRKEYLPHHIQGSITENGDEYRDKSSIHGIRSKLLDKRNLYSAQGKYGLAKVYKMFARLTTVFIQSDYDEGSWYGNDTISKTIADINKIVYHADKDGILRVDKTRKVLIVGDLVVSGEKEGPVYPSPKNVGIICTSDNPIYFDEVVAAIMGFDSNKIPTIKRCKSITGKYSFNSASVCMLTSNIEFMNNCALDEIPGLGFIPTKGWMGHIEKE